MMKPKKHRPALADFAARQAKAAPSPAPKAAARPAKSKGGATSAALLILRRGDW